jgi:hypothetical protein
MVVHDFNVRGAFIGPSEADAILIVDPDTVLPLAIAAKGLKAIAWWASEVQQLRGCVQHIELAGGYSLKCLPTRWAPAVAEEPFAIRVGEALDHCLYMVRTTYQSTVG